MPEQIGRSVCTYRKSMLGIWFLARFLLVGVDAESCEFAKLFPLELVAKP